MLKYKHDDRVFYIGKYINLSIRLYDHYARSPLSLNRLGLFLKMVGWINVSVHILEFCSELELDDREHFYIKFYLPSLNRKFSRSYSSKVNRSLNGLLSERRIKNRMNNSQLNKNFNSKSPLWVYSLPELKLISNSRFESFIKFKKFSNLRINNRTIYNYVDTLTPYNGLLFLSSNILISEQFKIVESNLMLTPNYTPKPIWVYSAKDLSMLNEDLPFKSISAASSFLNISNYTISSLLNKKIAISAGYYFFDHPISNNLKFELLSLPNIRDKVSNLRKEVWVYDFKLNLINNKPFPSQQEMLRYLGLKRFRTIQKYIDTEILFKNYFFFSREINKEEI